MEPQRLGLMRPLNSFVGRTLSLQRLTQLWEDGVALVTITGVGGMGKTRLVLEFMDQLAASQPDTPAWFCDLTQAQVEADMLRSLAHATGTNLSGAGAHALERVVQTLKAQPRALLVLDNVEQLVALVAAPVATLIRAVPGLCCVVTSRERLALAEEHVLALGPLGLPEAGQDAQRIEDAPAVQLFVQRVRQHDASFQLTGNDARAAADLVCHVEGMPLAIELAASRMRMMGVQALLQMVQTRLGVLSDSAVTHPARHRTLHAMLDGSWELLTPPEQNALAACSLFRGPFALNAAAAVMDVEPSQALELLSALHDKSLVTSVVHAQTALYRLYVPVAEYAAQKLANHAASRAHMVQRYHRYMVDQGRALLNMFDTDEDDLATRMFPMILDGLVDVVRAGATDAQQAQGAVRAALALDAWLTRTGPVGLHQQLLQQAVDAGERFHAPEDLLAGALAALGRVKQFTATSAESLQYLQAAVDRARCCGNAAILGRCLSEWASLLRRQGHLDQALPLFEEAVASLQSEGNTRMLARVHGELGITHKEGGDLPQAHQQYQLALGLLQRVGDVRHQGRVLADLGALYQEEGNLARARGCFMAALELHRRARNDRNQALVLADLGALAFEEGNLPEAVTWLQQTVAILERMGDQRTRVRFEAMLAGVRAAQGDVDVAQRMLEPAQAYLAQMGYRVWAVCADLYQGHVDLVRWLDAQATGKPGEADGHRARLLERLVNAEQPGRDGSPPASRLSDDVRLAARILRRAIGRARVLETESAMVLRVGPRCESVAPPGASRIQVAQRPTVRRMLQALVEARRTQPGTALGEEQLIAATWPDEKMVGSSAQNRLHVTLTTLRKLGLRDVLLRTDDGYLLDPAVPLVVEEDAGA